MDSKIIFIPKILGTVILLLLLLLLIGLDWISGGGYEESYWTREGYERYHSSHV